MTTNGRGLLVAAAVASLIATPVAVWWMVGDLSASASLGTHLDYLILPPAIDPLFERIAGIAALIVAVASIAFLTVRRRGFDGRWWAALVPALVALAVAGAGMRVLAMGTTGANIGAGLTLIAGGPLVGLLLLWSVGWSMRIALAR